MNIPTTRLVDARGDVCMFFRYVLYAWRWRLQFQTPRRLSFALAFVWLVGREEGRKDLAK